MIKKLLGEDSFWKFLVIIEELKEKKETEFISLSLGIDEETLQNYCRFLQEIKFPLLWNSRFIFPVSDSGQSLIERQQAMLSVTEFTTQFKFSEWLALQFILNIAKNEQPINNSYAFKLLENKVKHEKNLDKNLNNQIPLLSFEKIEKITEELSLKSDLLDFAIVQQKALELNLDSGETIIFFPYRQVYLTGELALIGESTAHRALIDLPVAKMTDMKLLKNIEFQPTFSQIEINKFIERLCNISEREERLVLKVYSREEVDLMPDHHYLGNPYVTSSSDGDLIWAATMEMCEQVYEWLYKIKDHIEILDPEHVRREFVVFCEENERYLINKSKKVS